MNLRSKFLLLLFLLLFHFCFSQNKEGQKEQQMEQVIESIAESDEVDIDNSTLLEDLTSNAEHPININSASEDDLSRLNLLDFNQIQNIINYRKKYGRLVSNSELSAIEGLTPDIVAALEPFITFEPATDSITAQVKGFKNDLMTRMKATLPQSKGFHASSKGKEAVYPGPPLSLYSRYHLDLSRKIEMGLIIDNDAGEQLFKGSNRLGFDYYSGFISVKGNRLIRQVTVGDFLLRVGQGVSLGGGSVLGKSGNTMGILKFGQTVRPYTSTDENRFFRGISAILGSGRFKFALFYSNKNRDANILTDRASGNQYFTSLQTSGYHRTLSEIEDEKSLNEQFAGGYGELRFDRFRIGGLVSTQKFNFPMLNGSAPYKAKSFSGTQNYNLGLDYQLALSHIQCFGEAGLSKNSKPAIVQGVVWHASPQLSLSTYFRYFDPGYQSFYGGSLSESSGNRNETGLYTGFSLSPVPKVKIFGYIDIYHFPWLTYSTTAPSSGSDYLAQVDIQLTRKFNLYLRGKFESKPQKVTGGQGLVPDRDENTTKLRIQGGYAISERITLRTRFEYSGYNFNDQFQKGFLVFQDMVYAPSRSLKIWLRYAWFNTDGYNARIYMFENDLLYSFSIPEFHGNGHRVYLNLKWSPSRRITAYLKTGCTIHNGVSSWGSGNDVTEGNSRIEIRGMIHWRF